MDWENVTMTDMMKAIAKLVKPDAKGTYSFDVSLFEDGEEKEAFFVTVDEGALTWGEGPSGAEGAVPMQIKKGGMQTLKSLQEDGLSAAMRMMMTGHIYTTNPLGAQKWFDILEIGKEPLEKAMTEVLG